jgi:hypothetical protein
MKQKTLNDFPEYVKINSTVEALRREEQEIAQRIEEIGLELSKSKQAIDGQDAWIMALEGKGLQMEDAASSLKEEFQMLEGRRRFVAEALAVGVMALDSCRGRCSLEICAAVRPEWTAQIRLILEALKTISESNQRLDVMRATLERDGVVTGALPFSRFDIGGSWSDPYGGRVTGYQREASENFPELAGAADQSVKLKIKALNERERRFERRFEEGASE